MPALTLIPAVLAWGLVPGAGELPGNAMASLVGAANVALAWYLLAAIGVNLRPRLVIVIGFAFTVHWWVAGMAGTHHYAQAVATFFLLAALNLAVRHARPMLAGLALGLAAASRLPTGMALLLLLGGACRERASWSLVAAVAASVAVLVYGIVVINLIGFV